MLPLLLLYGCAAITRYATQSRYTQMAKGNKGAETQVQAETQAVAVAVEAKPAGARVLVVKPGLQFRGARQAWYARLLQHNGKTVAEFTASVLAAPPSTPAKGVYAGRCEPPAGWLAWFAAPARGVLTYQ